MAWSLSRSVSAVTGPALKIARPLTSMLPHLPWYAWAGGVGALAVLLLSARAAGATAPDEEPGGGPERPDGPPPLLQLGSKGPWVSYLQARLLVPVTGTFDAVTDKAVRDFQQANGLTVDGKVGNASWDAMGVTTTAPSPGGGGPAPAPKPQPGPSTPAPAPTPSAGNPFGLSNLKTQREGQILALVQQGSYEHPWHWLEYDTPDGHHVKIRVSRRALALSDGTHRLIVSTSFNTAQKVADMIGAAMGTTRIWDEAHRHAGTKIQPQTRSWNTDSPVTGGNTDRMYEQSNAVNAKVAQAGDSGFVDGEGKDWVITRRFWNPPAGTNPNQTPANTVGSPHNSANFGWYSDLAGLKSPGDQNTAAGGKTEKVYQSIGLAHDRDAFQDYSQYLRFVDPNSLEIDGVPRDWGAALADPTVSKYIQDEGGTIPSSRHPDL